jgi:hypothetical protein
MPPDVRPAFGVAIFVFMSASASKLAAAPIETKTPQQSCGASYMRLVTPSGFKPETY